MRARWALALALGGSLPVLALGDSWPERAALLAVLAVGLLAAFAGWFTYRFSPALNVLRGKPAGYVSAEPRAALFDRVLTRLGWGLLPAVRRALLAGVVLYLLALAAGYYINRLAH